MAPRLERPRTWNLARITEFSERPKELSPDSESERETAEQVMKNKTPDDAALSYRW